MWWSGCRCQCRPETKKPVENVVWPEKGTWWHIQGICPPLQEAQKRRSRDPTKFKVVCNAGGEILEYEGEITSGDPIMLICEFTIDDPETRAQCSPCSGGWQHSTAASGMVESLKSLLKSQCQKLKKKRL